MCDKIFAYLSLDGDDYFALKCNPDYAIELRDRYSDIEPAYHWNKKYWNHLRLQGFLSEELIQSLTKHSDSEVVAKLPKKVKSEHPELLTISI